MRRGRHRPEAGPRRLQGARRRAHASARYTGCALSLSPAAFHATLMIHPTHLIRVPSWSLKLVEYRAQPRANETSSLLACVGLVWACKVLVFRNCVLRECVAIPNAAAKHLAATSLTVALRCAWPIPALKPPMYSVRVRVAYKESDALPPGTRMLLPWLQLIRQRRLDTRRRAPVARLLSSARYRLPADESKRIEALGRRASLALSPSLSRARTSHPQARGRLHTRAHAHPQCKPPTRISGLRSPSRCSAARAAPRPRPRACQTEHAASPFQSAPEQALYHTPHAVPLLTLCERHVSASRARAPCRARTRPLAIDSIKRGSSQPASRAANTALVAHMLLQTRAIAHEQLAADGVAGGAKALL